MHHIKVIKDGNVNNVVKEQLVDGVQYVDDEPREGSLNGITSDAVAKVAGDVGDVKDVIPEGTSEENPLVNEVGLGELAERVTTAEGDIDSIEGKIPSGASSSNKLVTESDLEAAQDSWQSGFTPKGEATVSQIDALTTQSNGDQYIVTDSGTITAGSVAVVAGDTVAWNATDEVWYKVNQYAKASEQAALTTYAQNVAHSIAPEFDPTRTSENPYKAGEPVTYTDGKVYTFTAPHYGVWTGTDVIQEPIVKYIDKKNKETISLSSNVYEIANFSASAQEDRFLRFEKSAALGYDAVIPSESKFLRVDKLKGLSFVQNNFFDPSSSYDSLPYTFRDVTFESVGNGGVRVHGTATDGDSTCFIIRPFTFQAGHKYLLRGCPSGGSSSTYFLSWGLLGNDEGDGKMDTPASDSSGYVYIRVKSGTSIDKVFYPQLVDLTLWFGAGNEPANLSELDASTFPKSVIPYDTGTLKHAAVEKIKVYSGATEISSFEMPSDLLVYLSDKGYGMSYGSKANVLDIEQRKYIKEGSFVGSTWVDDPQEYDVSDYIGDVTMKCAKNYVLRTYSGAELLYTNADLSVINIVDNLKSDTDTNTDLSKYQVDAGTIISTDQWSHVSDPSTYNHYVIPITGKKNILTVTAGAVDAFMVGVKSYAKPSVSYTPIANLSDSWYRRIEIEAGKTWSFVVPEDVKYIFLNRMDDGVSCVADFSLTQTTNNMLGELYDKSECLHHLKMCAQNVRDFSDGSGDGMPDALVSEKLPLWKAHITDRLNGDFLSIIEWFPYFDRSQTIDAYETLFKQFYPYKYALGNGPVPTFMLMSKHKGTFMNLQVLGRVRFQMPTLVCNINGYSVAVVAWVQSVADTPEDRMDSYANAIKVLSAFDKVILGGDFNTEVGMEELEVWTNAGYVLGNGGYWGEIVTWSDRTPNDNIVTRGFHYEKFSAGEYLTSDHKNVTAELSFE